MMRPTVADFADPNLHTGANTFLITAHKTAQALNQTKCWICMHLPHSSAAGAPVIPVALSLPRLLQMVATSVNVSNSSSSVPVHQSGCYEQWAGAWRPSYNGSTPPPSFSVKVQNASVCLRRNGSTDSVGTSTCDQYFDWENGTGSVSKLNLISNCSSKGPYKISVEIMSVEGELKVDNGTYFVCGPRAYPWLPYNWTGSCYLANILPQFHHHNHSPGYLPQNLHVHRRSMSWYEKLFGVFVPPYGLYSTNRELEALQAVLESVANDTAEAFSELSTEMVAIRTVALQNRMALDLLLAEKGGTCVLIGSECCTYIPDSSENITNLVSHMRSAVQGLNRPADWLSNWFSGWSWDWLSKIGMFLLLVLVMFMIIFCCVVPLLRKLITSSNITGPASIMLMRRGENKEPYDDYEADLGNIREAIERELLQHNLPGGW